MKSENVYQVILLTFFGTFGSILVGLVFFGLQIFNPLLTAFQYTMAGFYGSIFFGLLEYKSTREQIFGIIFILIFHLVVFTGRYLSFSYIMRDVFYLGSLVLSMKLYYLFLKRNPKLKFYLKSFALAFIYGLINIIMLSIVFIITAKQEFPPAGFIYIIARSGILIGLGMGLGIDFYLQNKNRILTYFRAKIA